MKIKEKYYESVGEQVYFTRLSNGLTIHLIPKEDYYETYGIITTKFGSVDTRILVNGHERQYPAGIAHFLEHKVFEDENGQDYLKKFVHLGSESNAFTSFTKTSYLFSTTSKVPENIQLLLEMVSKVSFTEKSVSKEREIIQQEIGMYQDSPDYRLFFGALENLYPGTPLADDIAGTRESISDITIDNLRENFDLFYHPSQMHLLVIGNFDVDEVLQVVKKYDLVPPHPSVELERFPVEKNEVKLNQSCRMEVATPKLAIGIRGNDIIKEEEKFRYKLMLKLLFSMMFGWTSQRFQSLYEAGKIDNSLTLEVEVEELFHFVILTMDTQEPVSLSHQFRSAIKQFEKDPDVNQEHLDTIKSEMFGDFLHGLNSLDYIATQFNPIETGENLFDLPKILQSISLQDVVKVGRDFVNACDMTDFIIFPK